MTPYTLQEHKECVKCSQLLLIPTCKTSCSGISKSISQNIPTASFYVTSANMSNRRRWSMALPAISIFHPSEEAASTAVTPITITLYTRHV
jgi:hypothetical protein